jgi:hypothetical protein
VLRAEVTSYFRDNRESGGARSQGRAFTKLAVPLKKSLLCNAAARPKSTTMKKVATTEPMFEHQLGRKNGKASTAWHAHSTVDVKDRYCEPEEGSE